MADLLDYLDKTVGKDNYLLFLTADHACAENANHLKDYKYDVKNVPAKDISKGIKEFSTATFGENLVIEYSNFNIYFNKETIKSKGLELAKVKQTFKDYLMTQEQVKRVYSEEDILASTGNDYYLNLINNGYDVSQNGDLVVLDKPGYIEYGATGTTHGTPYAYDTHAPLLFYGWKIKPGESFDKKEITQIAPTLAFKLKLELPNGTQSKVLEEVLEEK